MDYSGRIKKLQTYLHEHDLDVFLVLTKVNRQYLSSFTGSKGALLVTRKSANLYVDSRYTIRAKKESDLPVLPLTRLSATLSRPLAGEAGKGRGKKGMTVGVEDEITLYEMGKLKRQHKGVSLKVTRRVVDNIRAQKEPAELRLLRQGARIIDKTFEHVNKLIKKALRQTQGNRISLSEAKIAAEIVSFGKKLGAEAPAFDPIVASGANAAAPHHKSSTTKKIMKNNFLLLDFGFVVDGYNSDFTRTLFIGKPNKKQEAVYNIVLEAQRRAIAKIKPNQEASEVDRAARDYISKNFTPPQGSGAGFTHCSGHGVGLEIHEAPNLCPDSDELLPENCVVTVEPGIYLEGRWGVRIEDMVVVGKSPTVLSKAAKDFKAMIIN